MNFRSHAQVYEDLTLHSALHDVARGFYIDVGAHDPDHHSVTKLFYDRGWSGINIEPVSHWFDRLAASRGRDINLRIAAGAARGETELFEIPATGLSTTQAHFAERHQQAGWDVRRNKATVLPLSDICREHVQGEIHFLKIDAEGAESMILAGCDFARFRPWIVLIEATEPLTDVPAYSDSEAILLAAGYEFVATDALNRYYVAREHPELKKGLARFAWWAGRVGRLLHKLHRIPLLRHLAR